MAFWEIETVTAVDIGRKVGDDAVNVWLEQNEVVIRQL